MLYEFRATNHEARCRAKVARRPPWQGCVFAIDVPRPCAEGIVWPATRIRVIWGQKIDRQKCRRASDRGYEGNGTRRQDEGRGAATRGLPCRARLWAVQRADSMIPSICRALSVVEMRGAPFASSVTSLPWQSDRLQSVEVVCSDGGMPWHAPHLAWAPEVSLQAGTAAGSARFAPWQATFVHWMPSQMGAAARAVTSPENVTCTVPSRWTGSRIVVGTTWQFEQARGSVSVGFWWEGCAAVLGQGLSPVPWHPPHRPLPSPRSTLPFKCSGPPLSAVPVALASAWQPLQGPV